MPKIPLETTSTAAPHAHTHLRTRISGVTCPFFGGESSVFEKGHRTRKQDVREVPVFVVLVVVMVLMLLVVAGGTGTGAGGWFGCCSAGAAGAAGVLLVLLVVRKRW